MFVTLFLVMRFYFYGKYILGGAIITWLPQIIHNAYYRNRQNLPFLTIFTFSLNKLLFPIYFRLNDDNVIGVKPLPEPVLWAIGVVCLEILVLVCQSMFNPRFFLPGRCRGEEETHEYYKCEKQIKEINPSFDQMDCVICIQPLMKSNEKLYTGDDLLDGYNRKSFNFLQWVGSLKLNEKLTDFHRLEASNAKLEFMVTTCKHVFHTSCLEAWVKVKKECPSCRMALTDL